MPFSSPNLKTFSLNLNLKISYNKLLKLISPAKFLKLIKNYVFNLNLQDILAASQMLSSSKVPKGYPISIKKLERNFIGIDLPEF